MKPHTGQWLVPVLLALSARAAMAQDYRFPSSIEQWDLFYPTAYFDHDGVDWNCGERRYGGHQGSDFGAGGFAGMDEGRDILAAAAGTVDFVHDGEFDRCTSGCTGYGNNVRILHADGKTTRYAHLKQWSIPVAEGEEIACGQLLGQMGSSGNSTGPHLHFEVRSDSGAAHDPFWGDCSSPPSYWVEQWIYDKLPLPYCDDALPPCQPADVITCGAAIAGDNGAAGSTTAHLFYGCTEFAYSGPEMAWSFATDRDEPVTVTLTGLASDLDLYVVASPACAGEDCVAASSNTAEEDESLTFDASAGTSYTIVADGFEGAVTGFSLAVSCAGSLPTPDAGPTPTIDAGTTPSGDGGGSDDGGDGGSGADDAGLSGGCGCRTGDSRRSGSALLLVLAVCSVLRRSRRIRG